MADRVAKSQSRKNLESRPAGARPAADDEALRERIFELEDANQRLRERVTTLESGEAQRVHLRTLVDLLPDYLYVKDAESRFVLVNKAVADDTHRAGTDDLMGKTDFDMHPPAVADAFFAVEQELMRSGRAIANLEEVVADAAGAKKWLRTTKIPLRGAAGEIIGLVGIGRDITERKREEAMRTGQALVLEMIARNAPLGDVLERLVRLIESQVEGMRGSILLLDEGGKHLRHGAAPNLPEPYSRAIDGVQIGPEVGSCGTAAFLRRRVIVSDIEHDRLWANYRDLALSHGLRSCWSQPIISHQGTVLGTFAMYSGTVREPKAVETEAVDIATRIAGIAIERRRAEERIHYMAHHDALTGLPNRILLEDRLSQAILHARRSDRWVTIAFLDLDNFKLINDSLGHNAGDELLRVAARRMVACVRATDTVVRLGGDEFVILLCDQPKSTGAITGTLQKIRAAIAQPITLDGKLLHVTCSVGLAMYPNDSADPKTLLMNADAAMYSAKNAGRDNFQFYTTAMDTKVHERLSTQEELRSALARQEFRLAYQPQVDLKSGRIFGVEALIRWDHPKLGTIPPGQFIPTAEENGLIVPIGDWVLRTACSQVKAWHDAGLPHLNVSVNVSARQFREKNWVGRVKSALKESGLAAKHLELEVTESLLMQDLQRAMSTMRKLNAIGVGLAIDDFGTGYSNLSALRSFPVARLKIDRSFVENLPHDESDVTIAAAVISLGHKLNIRVIAEGVETEAQLAFLAAANCDEVQGHHLGHPMTPDEIVRLLTAGKGDAGAKGRPSREEAAAFPDSALI